MMSTLEANILGRKFRLASRAAESVALAEAIAIVVAVCEVIAQKQPTAEIERVLLLAALELAATNPSSPEDPRLEAKLLAMTAKLKRTIAETQSG